VARVTLFLALALQLLGCLAPANAFVICVSNDGCVELEPVVPGASRCAEHTCDEAHAGDASHACRDIPVLVDAGTPSRSLAADRAPLLTALVATPQTVMTAIAAPPRGRTATPRTAAPPRTVVLQL
jgi:hypothetical protein